MSTPSHGADGRALLGLLLATVTLLACPRAAVGQAPVNVTYGGNIYEVSPSFGNASVLQSALTSTFWYPNPGTAEAACRLVNGSLGAPNPGDVGPIFYYFTDTINYYAYAFDDSTQACTSKTGLMTEQLFYALSANMGLAPTSPSPSLEASPEASPSASPDASPEASPSASPDASPSASPEVSPSPSPDASPEASPSASPEASPSPSPVPLDCSLAAFSPPILSSRVAGQICAASKAVRQGKQSKLVTNVTLSLLAANNQPATINITDIVINKLTAGWQCRCRPNKLDNCTCLPNAWLLGGGNFMVFPQWRRSTRPGNIVDTTLQVSFTATAVDGGTCSGTAVICSAWNVPRNQPPPACTPFNSTGVTRPALTCI